MSTDQISQVTVSIVTSPSHTSYCIQIGIRRLRIGQSNCKKIQIACLTSHGLECHTGWQGCIGCLKMQVVLNKRATNDRALLQKTTYKDKVF